MAHETRFDFSIFDFDGNLLNYTIYVDGILNRISNELDKLSCFAEEGSAIGLAEVESVVGARTSGLRDLAVPFQNRRSGLARHPSQNDDHSPGFPRREEHQEDVGRAVGARLSKPGNPRRRRWIK